MSPLLRIWTEKWHSLKFGKHLPCQRIVSVECKCKTVLWKVQCEFLLGSVILSSGFASGNYRNPHLTTSSILHQQVHASFGLKRTPCKLIAWHTTSTIMYLKFQYFQEIDKRLKRNELWNNETKEWIKWTQAERGRKLYNQCLNTEEITD